MVEVETRAVGRRRSGSPLLRWGAMVACAGLLGLMALGRLAGVGCAAGDAGPAPLPAMDGAATRPASAAGEDLMAGSWAGTWTSSKGEMSGALRCRIEPAAGNPGAYTATFDAVFAKVFTHRSTVTLSVQRKGAAWEFTGREDLGLLKGGVYTYQGRTDGTEFVCNYSSSMDTGTFRMRRVTPLTTRPAP